ncbi:hypothetical protein M427DRAFT_288866 [Gonapodya prolifera JEL478]|uniref:Uncharacterized protein n=1 Tax=Gonapodya prolifera (strain JEL478) TaxID=1344416 RepID=A0A139AJK5_GONPJ|nr:hypothetical protein M427DRAFT_288866 [Gonapodya prolifera JEL478]|eukprot:KXS16663.1 hypothetical protein M427DRAFT_288866 [Gonapodya prolifera JEL478]
MLSNSDHRQGPCSRRPCSRRPCSRRPCSRRPCSRLNIPKRASSSSARQHPPPKTRQRRSSSLSTSVSVFQSAKSFGCLSVLIHIVVYTSLGSSQKLPSPIHSHKSASSPHSPKIPVQFFPLVGAGPGKYSRTCTAAATYSSGRMWLRYYVRSF